jgi:uncharacterized membrane protein YphA (DoxX/SURF4 family)
MASHASSRGPGWVESVLVLTPVRLGLAALFGYAAVLKIMDPQSFAFAIKAFELVDPEQHGHLLTAFAFGIPWAELIISVMLVLGLWTRGAASLLTIMLAGFTAGLASLLVREIETECACFGEQDFLCSGAVGLCHLGRNAVLMLLTALLVWRGGGRLSVDRARNPGCFGGPDAGSGVDPSGDDA